MIYCVEVDKEGVGISIVYHFKSEIELTRKDIKELLNNEDVGHYEKFDFYRVDQELVSGKYSLIGKAVLCGAESHKLVYEGKS